MTTIAKLAKKYASIRVRLRLMAQAFKGISGYKNRSVQFRVISTTADYHGLMGIFDVLYDANLITWDEKLDAERDLGSFYEPKLAKLRKKAET